MTIRKAFGSYIRIRGLTHDDNRFNFTDCKRPQQRRCFVSLQLIVTSCDSQSMQPLAHPVGDARRPRAAHWT